MNPVSPVTQTQVQCELANSYEKKSVLDMQLIPGRLRFDFGINAVIHRLHLPRHLVDGLNPVNFRKKGAGKLCCTEENLSLTQQEHSFLFSLKTKY